MQTKGWDIAFKKLRVGDFVEIVLPSNMARGKDGVKGLIPPNAVNIIHVRVLGVISPTRIIDGTKVWLLEENQSNKLRATVENTVEFHYMVGTQSNPKYDISYRRNQPYALKFSDFGIVKGLKKALISAKRADKIWVLVPPSEAYGDKGLVDIVKPGESLFYDIFVTDVR
jgi:FKBP-type peptidyl-prolyl cis-trans isomerase